MHFKNNTQLKMELWNSANTSELYFTILCITVSFRRKKCVLMNNNTIASKR